MSFSFRRYLADDKPNFKGTKWSNKTHVRTTYTDALLLRKSKGQESMHCHAGKMPVDSVTGFVRVYRTTKACSLGGNA